MIRYIKWLLLKYAENKKILIFLIYFLNKDISLDMRLTYLKMAMHVYETHLEGRVSQNFDIGLSLNFIACRSGRFKKNTKNSQKLPVFCSKMKTRT